MGARRNLQDVLRMGTELKSSSFGMTVPVPGGSAFRDGSSASTTLSQAPGRGWFALWTPGGYVGYSARYKKNLEGL